MESMLRALYLAYVDAVTNPFFPVGASLQPEEDDALREEADPRRQPYPELSAAFAAAVGRIVTQHQSAA